MIFGTHPKQFNGYSKVVYELCKELALRKDRVQVSVFGFQNFHANAAHRLDLPDCIDVYDAFANENPKTTGFGINQVIDVVTLKRPDVLVVYNDLLVITQVLNQLKDIPNKWFRVVLYVDQVYLNQKREFIDFINLHADAAFAFTPSWKDCIVEQGMTLPCDVLEHGINTDVYYPIPKRVARKFFNLNDDDFIVLNLNRNQPRKRWDTCIKAFAHVIASHKDKPGQQIKFIIGTALRGAWDIIEVFQRELHKRGLTLADGLKHCIIVDNPQKLTDAEINVLYNASDCGINTADGEGVGLCSVEPAVIGIPQIVPRLGGYIDFFDDQCAIMVEPRLAYYVDGTRDMVGGEALMCDYGDFADAIEMYYADAQLRKRHGDAARKKILRPHLWSTIADHFVDVIEKVHDGRFGKAPPPPPPSEKLVAAACHDGVSGDTESSIELKVDDIVISDEPAPSQLPEPPISQRQTQLEAETQIQAQTPVQVQVQTPVQVQVQTPVQVQVQDPTQNKPQEESQQPPPPKRVPQRTRRAKAIKKDLTPKEPTTSQEKPMDVNELLQMRKQIDAMLEKMAGK